MSDRNFFCGLREAGCLYAVQVMGEEGWFAAEWCDGPHLERSHWLSRIATGTHAYLAGEIAHWIGPLAGEAADWGGCSAPPVAGRSYAVLLSDGWHRCRFGHGGVDAVWLNMNGVQVFEKPRRHIGPLAERDAILAAPSSWGFAEEAALREQGADPLATPGQVIGDGVSVRPARLTSRYPFVFNRTLTDEERAAVMAAGPGPGFVVERDALPLNLEPEEGRDYWVWLGLGGRMQWVPARYHTGIWLPCHNRVQGVPGEFVKFWRGPLVPPAAPQEVSG